MLSLENIKLVAGVQILIRSLSVTLLPGSITYITGKNGAGKTTFLQTIAGLKSVIHGKIAFHELQLTDYIKPYCLYIGHNLALEKEMTVIDQLEFWANCYNSEQMIPAAIQFWDLGEILDQPIGYLSAGNAKKIALSKLTCCHADLWLLDEVETNMDDNNLKFLHLAMSIKASSGGIIIISTHQKNRVKNSQEINLGDFSD